MLDEKDRVKVSLYHYWMKGRLKVCLFHYVRSCNFLFLFTYCLSISYTYLYSPSLPPSIHSSLLAFFHPPRFFLHNSLPFHPTHLFSSSLTPSQTFSPSLPPSLFFPPPTPSHFLPLLPSFPHITTPPLHLSYSSLPSLLPSSLTHSLSSRRVRSGKL